MIQLSLKNISGLLVSICIATSSWAAPTTGDFASRYTCNTQQGNPTKLTLVITENYDKSGTLLSSTVTENTSDPVPVKASSVTTTDADSGNLYITATWQSDSFEVIAVFSEENTSRNFLVRYFNPKGTKSPLILSCIF